MTFTVGFGPQWLAEWPNYLPDQKAKVAAFIYTFQASGLDQTKFQGRISPSWMNLVPGSDPYEYTTSNWLWHYHIGLPTYKKAAGGDVSDWVLHFQWIRDSTHLDLIELSTHQVRSRFYLPLFGSLVPKAGSTGSS